VKVSNVQKGDGWSQDIIIQSILRSIHESSRNWRMGEGKSVKGAEKTGMTRSLNNNWMEYLRTFLMPQAKIIV
jgi:hypothetical protein